MFFIKCVHCIRDPTLSTYYKTHSTLYVVSCSEELQPLLGAEEGTTGGGMGEGLVIVRPKDKLREEIKAAKRRRKEEKRRLKEIRGEGLDLRKLNAKLERLQRQKSEKTHAEGKATEFVVPPVTFEGPKTSSNATQKPAK